MKPKKLKDLKKGDRVYYQGYTSTTPIIVTSKKRTGMMVEITLKWGESEYTCYGHALSTACTGYSKKFHEDLIFSTDYERELRDEQESRRNAKLAAVGRCCKELLLYLKESLEQ